MADFVRRRQPERPDRFATRQHRGADENSRPTASSRISISVGDVIANSSGIAALRSEMSGRRLDLPSVSSAVMKVFGHGDNFILGIGDLANLVKLITRAQ